MASPINNSIITQNAVYPFLEDATAKKPSRNSVLANSLQATALSVEFVAKPQEALRAESAIPEAIAGALKDVTGFAGCLVMVSDQEARLVTVVTLWSGAERAMRCKQNVRWVKALLAPYVDRCLRVQTMNARLPHMAMSQKETKESAFGSEEQKRNSQDETVCVA